MLLTAGAVGDRFGRKLALLGGLGLFSVGALVGGIATTSGQVIAGRAERIGGADGARFAVEIGQSFTDAFTSSMGVATAVAAVAAVAVIACVPRRVRPEPRRPAGTGYHRLGEDGDRGR